MSVDWISTTVGEYSPFTYGKAIKKADQLNEGISVYGSNGVYAFSAEALVEQHAVIIGRKGSVGKVHLSTKPCWISDTAFYTTKDTREEAYFVYYLLSSLGLEDMNTDAAVPGLNRNNAHRLEIKIPSTVEERVALVEPLINLDKKIELNRQTNQALEQIAQAIFKSWFVDFEPVKAKIAALEAGGSEDDALLAAMQAIAGSALFVTDTTDADAPTQLARLQAEHPEQYATLRATAELFPSAMQESELGEIPEGWGVNKVSSQVDVLNGFAFKSADYVEKPGVFVLRTKNFNNIGIAEQQHDDVFLPEVFNVSHKKYLCEPYDYHLIMVGASVGKRGIIFPGNLPAIRNQNMWCFRPKLGADVGKAFTKYMVDELTSQKIGLASGSAREFFRKGDFQNQEICFANALIQKKFDEVVFPLLEKQAMNIAENEYLSNLRDSLHPKLLSGELSISAATDQITQAEEAIDV